MVDNCPLHCASLKDTETNRKYVVRGEEKYHQNAMCQGESEIKRGAR